MYVDKIRAIFEPEYMCSVVTFVQNIQYKLYSKVHQREVTKVVSYSRWSLNARPILLIYEWVLYQNSGLLKQWIA